MTTITLTIRTRGAGIPSLTANGHSEQQSKMDDQSLQLRQHSIDRYVVDFVTLDGKLIVEVDGVTRAETSELARDKARSDILEACGFLVVRVSNTDVYDNIEGVLEMIETTLRSD